MSDIAERAAALAGGALASSRRVSGGDLSQVMRVTLTDGREVIAKHAGTARAESDMLRAIAATGAPSPAVVGVEDDLLIMEAIVQANGGLSGSAAWASLSDELALLHMPTSEAYGWPVDHAFGQVVILNDRAAHWPTFWADRRLRCHAPHVATDLSTRLEHLAYRLDDLLPSRPPSALLHGDLWGGNVLVGEGAVSALIDPACYYGHREVDVAMLTLFDHPPKSFFEALRLDAGWRDRLPIYRLWPLLVHLRLFGSGYRGRVSQALDQLGV